MCHIKDKGIINSFPLYESEVWSQNILRLIAEYQIFGFEQFAILTTEESICSKTRDVSYGH